MSVLYVLGVVFTVWMAVDAVRSDRIFPWLWIILFLPPLGAVAYAVAEHGLSRLGRFHFARRGATGADLERARFDVRRLDTAVAWTELASVLRQRGRAGEALAAAGEAVKRAGDDLDARHELGQALLLARRPAEAVRELEPVVERDRYHAAGAALRALAQAREAAGDIAGARQALEHLVERHSASSDLWELGRVQAVAGDSAAARATLQRLIDEAEYVPKYLRGQVRPAVWRARALLRKLPR